MTIQAQRAEQQTVRNRQIEIFINALGLSDAERSKIAGDASFRKYERLVHDGKSYVLMDSPPDKEPVDAFMAVDRELVRLGFSAPKILHADEVHGLLLLEDLGDDLYNRVLKRTPESEMELYLPAIEVLAELHRAPLELSLPPYDETAYMRELALMTDWYFPQFLSPEQLAELQKEYERLWVELLARLQPLKPVLVLRDYHADNLLWLPERTGSARVGLLDFQDALLGHPAYDLLSLLEDARRDVEAGTQEAMMQAYCELAGISDVEAFRRDYAIIGAQRNLKIVGIFHRLNRRDGKAHYLDYIPRVIGHLKTDLAHPALAPVAQLLRTVDAPIAEELFG